jgi:hypothetical protein
LYQLFAYLSSTVRDYSKNKVPDGVAGVVLTGLPKADLPQLSVGAEPFSSCRCLHYGTRSRTAEEELHGADHFHGNGLLTHAYGLGGDRERFNEHQAR